ncbi:MAG: hypothetical protein S4CHLAM7_11000 [Chlamydiae bacterium]|nr:hypothetical protein [Chlamydiota bacterium]
MFEFEDFYLKICQKNHHRGQALCLLSQTKELEPALAIIPVDGPWRTEAGLARKAPPWFSLDPVLGL